MTRLNCSIEQHQKIEKNEIPSYSDSAFKPPSKNTDSKKYQTRSITNWLNYHKPQLGNRTEATRWTRRTQKTDSSHDQENDSARNSNSNTRTRLIYSKTQWLATLLNSELGTVTRLVTQCVNSVQNKPQMKTTRLRQIKCSKLSEKKTENWFGYFNKTKQAGEGEMREK